MFLHSLTHRPTLCPVRGLQAGKEQDVQEPLLVEEAPETIKANEARKNVLPAPPTSRTCEMHLYIYDGRACSADMMSFVLLRRLLSPLLPPTASRARARAPPLSPQTHTHRPPSLHFGGDLL